MIIGILFYNQIFISYKMSIIFEKSDKTIEEIFNFTKTTSIAIQPFYNHNGIIYKLFILGNKWHIVTRKSIKNFDKLDSTIYFESNTISKKNSNSILHNTYSKTFHLLPNIVKVFLKYF